MPLSIILKTAVINYLPFLNPLLSDILDPYEASVNAFFHVLD